jgi:tRNA dimethylallyltransferase
MQKLVFIFGPTGAGKTEIACEIAEGIGEIVSVDSMQVYKGLELGTAKPTAEQLSRVRHHLVSIVPPDYRFSAGDFKRLALAAVRDIEERGKIPFLVGGTGLYFRAFEYGLADAPPADPAFRESLYREEERRKGSLYERLLDSDPEAAASLHPNDLVRIVRALEVHRLTGVPFSASVRGSFEKRISPLKVGLETDRETLYDRIETRCMRMLGAGLAEETRDLFARGYTERCPAMNGLGYSHFLRHLKGCCSREETVRLFVRDSKRYAKRQLTWFRKEADTVWYSNTDRDGVRRAVASYLGV